LNFRCKLFRDIGRTVRQNLKTSGQLRPVDLAREYGLSTQAIRNYEASGILPAAERTAHGYRTYTPRHVKALRAFLALVPGHGHPTATAIMQAINRDAAEDALRLIDESHAQALDDRRTLQSVEAALGDLEPVPQEGGEMFVGPLARRLGIRPATLRKWERAGVVRPRRDPRTGYRVYDAADVRDALLAHQLRRGGYLLDQIAPLIAQVRSAGGVAPLASMLHDWHARLSARSRAMLTGAAALDAYLAYRACGTPTTSETACFPPWNPGTNRMAAGQDVAGIPGLQGVPARDAIRP
jgi:DNA-binding transcriptional MerR regulator